jgi:hypothetical protein
MEELLSKEFPQLVQQLIVNLNARNMKAVYFLPIPTQMAIAVFILLQALHHLQLALLVQNSAFHKTVKIKINID